MPLTTELRSIAKALVAGTATAITAAIGLASDHGFTQADFLITIGAFLAGAFPTWVTPNKPHDEAGLFDPGSAALGLLAGLLTAYLILR